MMRPENIYFTFYFTDTLNLREYTYFLPQEKIAIYPLQERDTSKLLVYNGGKILHSVFHHLAGHLPENSFLVFNNTKVIPARMHFRKQSGAVIEVFLLNPVQPSALIAETMAATGRCAWHCTVGNLKKWPAGISLEKEVAGVALSATLLDRKKGVVEFTWTGGHTFAEVIRASGETPLPPYIRREAQAGDRESYQTVYSRYEGAVAAPTAGLHFTPLVFSSLAEKKVGLDFLTLHVSAGTFQPIKTDDPDQHVMHEEQVVITRQNIENLLVPGRLVTAVGTTSMRTLESLYWFGAKLLNEPKHPFQVTQRDPYTLTTPPPKEAALKAVLSCMDRNQTDTLTGETSIFIRPGYTFRICNALITNFHQPSSTLILLVAAFVGGDWKMIYEEALNKEYRFLSYGDSSLLLPRS
jgi:S-adenosylmethionine:tRNA ribosyltransferase-isomerase